MRRIVMLVSVLITAGQVLAGWLPIDTITNRSGEHDLTCENNARAVVSDSAGNVHVVWRGSVGSTAQLWYSRFDAASGQWSDDTVLFPDPRGTMDPVLALDSAGDLLVARFLRAIRMLKLFRRVGSSGQWLEVDSLVCGVSESLLSMSADRLGKVHFVWQYRPQTRYQIRYVQHDGARWLADTSFAQTDINLTQPAVAAGPDGDVMVAWRQSTAPACIVAKARRLGVWQRTDTLYNRAEGSSPCVAWGPNGSVHVVWVGGSPATGQWVVHRESTEAGWGETTRVASRYLSRLSPSVTADEEGNVGVAWSGDDPESRQRQVYHRCRTRAGTWRADTVVSSGVRDKGRVSLAACAGRVQIVWTEDPYGSAPAVRLRRYERVHDVGVLRIECPVGVVDSGSHFRPAAWLRNWGDYVESRVSAWFRVDSVVSVRVADSLAPGDSVRVEFDTLLAARRGWNGVRCSAYVAGDHNASNDVLRDSFFVRVCDVGADSVIEPAGAMPRGTIRPTVALRNHGNVAVLLWCRLLVTRDGMRVHHDSASVVLPAESAGVAAFAPWLGDTGMYTARCSVACPGDMHPDNDTASSRFELYWVDASVESLLAPRDTVDSGAMVVPAVMVRNQGSRAADMRVWLRVASYVDSLQLASIAPGADTLVRFAGWSAEALGWSTVRCSVFTVGDMQAENDIRAGSVFVRLVDVSADSVLMPDSVVRTDSVQPMFRVRNRGNSPVQMMAWFSITGEAQVYSDSVSIALRAGQDTLLGFAAWATTLGRFSYCCSVAAEGDRHPENNVRRRPFRVVRTDVGVAGISWPAGVVDSGHAGRPQAAVVNLGSDPETFRVRFLIGTLYQDTVDVFSLTPGETLEVAFDSCSLLVRGGHITSCSTLVAGDRNPANDCRQESVFVRVVDAGTVRVLAPLEVIGRGWVQPAAEVANHGNVVGNVAVWFDIRTRDSTVYADSQVVRLESGETRTVEFRAWEATGGEYADRCWVVLEGDMRHENDTMQATFVVARADAAVQAITSPSSVIVTGWVSPQVRVANLGDEPAAFLCRVTIKDQDSAVVYQDSGPVSNLGPTCSTAVTLARWYARVGHFRLTASVFFAGDQNPRNDTLSSFVSVESLPSRRWAELEPMPPGEWRRRPRAGACLVSVGNRFMSLKGGNTSECFGYSPAESLWSELARVPPGPDGRRVRGGAALCWDGNRFVYALKGGSTREFWRRDAIDDSWAQLPPLPEYTPKAKYGCGLAFHADRVYLVKASGTLDFLVFEVASQQWHARRSLPSGPWARNARHGTGFVSSGAKMFCLKGGTDEFYEYSINGDSWQPRRSLPMSGSGGRLTRPRRGAALAADGAGAVYAFKGGRTSESWCYDIARDTWRQLEDIPASNSRKKVHDGGSLACLGTRVYALKGGGSSEFWCYDASGLRTARAGPRLVEVTSGRETERTSEQAIFAGAKTSVAAGRTIVFDVLGRKLTSAGGAIAPGVYFYRVEHGGRTNKVVVR